MTTALDKTLKRELTIDGRSFVLAIAPDGLKLTLKGKRNGLELAWADLVSGEAALATALNASVGQFARRPPPSEPAARSKNPAGRSKSPARNPAAPRRGAPTRASRSPRGKSPR